MLSRREMPYVNILIWGGTQESDVLLACSVVSGMAVCDMVSLRAACGRI